jgi:hypothetical protein
VFRKPHNLKKTLTWIKKKPKFPWKCLQKESKYLKKLKISLKCPAFFKKNLVFSKNKASWQLPHCHNDQSALAQWTALIYIKESFEDNPLSYLNIKTCHNACIKFLVVCCHKILIYAFVLKTNFHIVLSFYVWAVPCVNALYKK